MGEAKGNLDVIFKMKISDLNLEEDADQRVLIEKKQGGRSFSNRCLLLLPTQRISYHQALTGSGFSGSGRVG